MFICIIGTAILLIWCYLEYREDEDVVEISFKKYGKDEDSIYPDISLCFDHPFNEDQLKSYDSTLTKSLYTLFLTGQTFFGEWNEIVLDINYENVSLHLKDYMIGDALLFLPERVVDIHNNISLNNFSIVSYPTVKCFTFNIPKHMKISKFAIALKNSIFPAGIRPKSGFDVILHLHQQMLRSRQFVLRNWPIRTSTSAYSYQMDISVKDIEILRLRNKPRNPCSNSISFDNDTLKDIVDSVGCIPPYMDISLKNRLAPCKTQNDLLRISKQFVAAYESAGEYENTISLCKEIQRIGVDVVDTDFNSSKILNGTDMDVNLDIPFIYESVLKNGKLYFDMLLQQQVNIFKQNYEGCPKCNIY